MATRLRLSNLLRQSVLKAFANSTQSPATCLPSAHVVCRGMAFTKLFVGGLALTTHEQTLRNEFAKFGDVIDVRIITHPDSGKSKGFGFITMADENQADTAIAGMDGKVVNARIISVNLAKPKKAPVFPGSFGQEGSVGQGSSVQGSFSEAGFGQNTSPKGSFGVQSGFGGAIQSGFTQGILEEDIQGSSSRVSGGQQEQNSSEFPHPMPNASATSQSGSLPLNLSVKTPHDATWEDFLNGIEFGSGQGDSSQVSKRDTENISLRGFVSLQSDSMKSNSVQENIGQGTATSSSGLGEQTPKTAYTDSWDSFLSKIESDSSSNSIEKI